MTSQSIIEGKISSSGYYKDCIPSLIINIKKQYANNIPHENNNRVIIKLIIGNRSFNAGIRTTEKSKYIKICQDIFTVDGDELRLCDELHNFGIKMNDTVSLKINTNCIEVLKSN